MTTENNTSLGVALVVSAPSGAGKSTIINLAREQMPSLGFSVSCTTRSPRPGEVDGEHYHFLTHEEFQLKVDAGEFLEHAEFSGNCYGTLRREVEDRLRDGQDVILEIEVQGADQIREAAKEGLLNDRVFYIFISPPSMDLLEVRLRDRGTETEEAIQKRLAAAAGEMAHKDKFDTVVISDIAEVAAADFIRAVEKMKASLNKSASP